MGCAYSQKHNCDNDPTVFEVMNVGDSGTLVSPGKLKITESDIIFEQNNKSTVIWPLRCLRRYGYDAEIFSFEAGRRCSTGPGIYAFKCSRAAQLFNLVQTNIQVCTNGDDTISREMLISALSGPTITRSTIAAEPNYLDPTPFNNGPVTSTFSYNQNGFGRLSSFGSSSGPMSPQETMGSPSPPPVLPLSLPPPPPIPQIHPSSYVNEETVHTANTVDMEHNNNRSLGRRSMQRSYTVSSSTSSSGFLSSELVSGQANSNEVWTTAHNSAAVPSQTSVPSYMNVDLGSDASPLSPSYSTCDSSTPLREEAADAMNASNSCTRAYMNISPGQEKIELMLPVSKPRPPTLSILPMQSEPEEEVRHCYANLETSEIEGLKKRFSGISTVEKLPIQSQTPPPFTNTGTREVSYAVLDLDKKDVPVVPPTIQTTATTTVITATTTITATSATASGTTTAVAAATTTAVTTATNKSSAISQSLVPDLPQKSQPNGYVTIDFNKTAALSHSVNSSLVNDIDEGSRKTRHNSTISELITS